MSSPTPLGTGEPVPPQSNRPRKPRYAVTVKRVRRLTPHMLRVTFSGDELANFAWNGPAAHIKLFFSESAAQPAGSASDSARPVVRTYTPRRFDRATCELDVDFVVHGEGPASAWAEQAAPGQPLAIAGPGRSYEVHESAQWYVLAGDDTAIPAISTILEALPRTMRVIALLEIVDAGEEHVLVPSSDVEIRWLPRGPDPARAGAELERALRQLEFPGGSGRIYVACEADAMRRIRRHLLTERGIPRADLVTRGYWKLGATDHPDRDYGEEIT
jgi:NADPH-dependent ferric siderophore reductase